MILTGPEIRREFEAGRIRISPFRPDQINPNSYNFRLGKTLKKYVNYELDPKIQEPIEEIEIPTAGLALTPDRIYLGHTHERMGSNYYVPIIRGRSSVARLGLFIHVTADMIDIGSYNQWTLQLHAVQPVTVYRNMLIGQVTFWCVKGEIILYDGKYQSSSGPIESQIYREFPTKGS